MTDAAQQKLLRFFEDEGFALTASRRIAVAVSGGGDSMACLDLMRRQVQTVGFRLRAVTVDHGLRPEAKGEIALVAQYCDTHGVDHSVLRWAWDHAGNLQAEARAARYRLIADWAQAAEVELVLLAHTKTDVAETFLMRLARKAGVDGLARMDRMFVRHGTRWGRPLLDVSRGELRAYLQDAELSWADDASNEDDRFDRVKARRVLDALGSLGISEEVLSHVSGHLWTANAALDSALRETVRRCVEEQQGDLLLPTGDEGDAEQIADETLYRLRGAALRWVGGAQYPPRSDAVAAMTTTLKASAAHTLAGCVITKEADAHGHGRRWRVTREFNAVKTVKCATDQLWDGRWKLNGGHDKSLEIRALGDAVSQTAWRDAGVPRTSLMASPSVWHGNELIAAPLAGFGADWTAKATGRGKFAEFLISR